MRRLRAVALVLGTLLLGIGVSGVVLLQHQSTERDHTLLDHLQGRVLRAQGYFHTTTTTALLLSHDQGLVDVFADVPPGEPLDRVPLPQVGTVHSTLSYLETLFPAQVREATLLDAHGNELARVVRGRPARGSELRRGLDRSTYFGPALGMGYNGVYQDQPARSPFSPETVLGTAAPVRDVAGRSRGVLYFAVAVDGLRAAIAGSSAGTRTQIVAAANGVVLLDSADPTVGVGGGPAPIHATAGWGESGLTVIDGRRAAYRYLQLDRGNANSWYVVEIGGPARTLTGGTEAAWTAVSLGLVLLLLSTVGFVQHSRRVQTHLRRDELTGLGNRRALNERLARDLARDEPGAVLLVDLDRFKQVNDALGHAAGDELLVEVARRFLAVASPRDLVTRLGGDEFAVLVSGRGDAASAMEAARLLLRTADDPVLVGGQQVHLGLSVGVALLGEHGGDPSTLLRRADIAMYEAKRRRTGVALFSAGMERQSAAGLAVETSLLQAMERGEIVLHYQPQVDLRSGEVSGMEALVRWEHPERGLLGPLHFIPAAEESGLINAVTRHVLAVALDQVVAWRADGCQVPVSVNLAARNLADPDLPVFVRGLLADRGLPPSVLCLELTETDLLGDPEQARAALEELQAMGVALAVDDFGTGFASLSQLRQLPFHELKIDKSFVAVLEGDREAVHIVDSIVELAHGLGLRVTAEGVETAGCLAVLASVGCDTVQGYHFSKPLPPAAALAWMREHDHASVVPPQPNLGRSEVRQAASAR